MNQERRITLWALVGCLAFAMGYIFAITFIPVPKNNVRFADTILGALVGITLTGIVSRMKDFLFPSKDQAPDNKAEQK